MLDSWGYYSQYMESHKSQMFQTTNQHSYIFPLLLVYTLLTTINITIFQTTNQHNIY